MQNSKLTAKDLERELKKAADVLRKSLNASENYKLVLPLLFVKKLNDDFIEKAEFYVKEKNLRREEAYENPKRHTFFLPKGAEYRKLQEASEEVGAKINEVFHLIEGANPKLEDVLINAEFNNTKKYTDEGLKKIIKIFSVLNLANYNLENEDVFGDAYEFLLEEYAGETKKKGGQFYTPRQVVRLMVNLVKPSPGIRICDPTCGSGGMLIQSMKYLEKHFPETEHTNLTLEGQDSNPDTVNLCKMNLVIHGITEFKIEDGDVLENPKLIQNGLKTYDKVLANFPFSENWDNEGKEKDSYGRFVYGIPPEKGKADFAFIQHMLSCLNEHGQAAIVASQGVLFRKNEERTIRKNMILGIPEKGVQGDVIEAIIALPPAIFYGTPIPGCILVLNRNKPEKRKNKILFYYAAHKEDYFEQPKRNLLRDSDVDKIIEALKKYEDVDRYCRIADLNELKENDYNLNVSRYVDISEPEEEVDIQETIKSLNEFESKFDEFNQKMKRDLDKLKFVM